MSEIPKIIFPHLPKTGGTALLYHFQVALGAERVLTFGPHSRVRRFFSDRYQIEELDDEAKAQTCIIQGHGVDENTFPLLRDRQYKLMVVLRGAPGLVRSRFNQSSIGAKRRGGSRTPEQFWDNYADNAVSHAIVRMFPNFVDDPQASLGDRVISVLRKFDYVYTTEQLAAQSAAMMRFYGLPTDIAHRRVAGEKKLPLHLTDAEILARQHIDQDVFEKANTVITGDGRSHNPFGFDAEGRERAIAKISSPSDADLRRNCYDELARALCANLCADAAMSKLALEQDQVPVKDKAEFAKIFIRHYLKKSGSYGKIAQQKSVDRARSWMARAMKRVDA
ncbi:MAG: hypothetical protein AAFP16_02370 [Pseudomonadota bacterium]